MESIFRAYDVRGIYGKELTEEKSYKIGLAFSYYLGERKKVVVGRDGRRSSLSLEKSFMKGLADGGCIVLDLELTATPILYYAIKSLEADGGAMITASHNPPEWNGIKFCDSHSLLIAEGYGIEKIRQLAEKELKAKGDGRIVKIKGVIESYIRNIKNMVKDDLSGLKVVIDPGGGSAALLVRKLLENFGIKVYGVNEKIDPDFKTRSPNPTADSLKDLKEKVLDVSADFGVAFDGDADRAVFVSNNGRVIQGDLSLIIFCKSILPSNPGGKVIYDVSCSSAVKEVVKKLKGIPIEYRVGHSFIMRKMIKENAILGGEISGHFYFGIPKLYSDGLYATIEMAKAVKRLGNLENLIKNIPTYYSTGLFTMHCPDNLKKKVISRLEEKLSKEYMKISKIDGVKVYIDDGWALIRPSNTMPQIKLKIEAKKQKTLEKIKKNIISMVRESINEFLSLKPPDRSKL